MLKEQNSLEFRLWHMFSLSELRCRRIGLFVQIGDRARNKQGEKIDIRQDDH